MGNGIAHSQGKDTTFLALLVILPSNIPKFQFCHGKTRNRGHFSIKGPKKPYSCVGNRFFDPGIPVRMELLLDGTKCFKETSYS